jgi:plasmid maintenance system antidote protein VapI
MPTLSENLKKARKPAECFHPSVFIKEEMEARGWSMDDLALRMAEGDVRKFGVERLALDIYFEVGPTEPNLIIGDDSARMLAAVFDVNPEFFLNLQKSWREWFNDRAIAKAEQAEASR